MEERSIKGKLENGDINMGLCKTQKSTWTCYYEWDAYYERVPKENLLLRFKWFNTDKVDSAEFFVQYLASLISRDLNIKYKNNKFNIQVEYQMDEYNTISIPESLEMDTCNPASVQNGTQKCMQQWIIIYLTPDKLEVYDGKGKYVSKKGDFPLNLFHDEYVKSTYHINNKWTSSGWMNNLELFIDLTEYQLQTIVQLQKFQLKERPKQIDRSKGEQATYFLENQYLNLMEDKGIKPLLEYGSINMKSDNKYLWSQMPQDNNPQNMVLRFKWYTHTDFDHSFFSTTQSQFFQSNKEDENGDIDPNRFQIYQSDSNQKFSIFSNELQNQSELKTKSDLKFQPNGCNNAQQQKGLEYCDTKWVVYYFEKDQYQFYSDDGLLGTTFLQSSLNWDILTKTPYYINKFNKYSLNGYVENLEVFQNLKPEQLSYILNRNTEIDICQPDEVIDEKCCWARLLENTSIQSNLQFNYDSDEFTFSLQLDGEFEARDSCISGYILDSQGDKVSYQGDIINPQFQFSLKQVEQYCQHISTIDNLCEFKYIVQIGQVIQVIYDIQTTIQISYKNNVSAKFQYSGLGVNKQMVLQEEQYLKNLKFKASTSDYPGKTINQNYTTSITLDKNIEQFQYKTVLYSSYDFKKVLKKGQYKYGDFVFIQLQPEKNIQKGYKPKFIKATYGWKNILPFDASYNDQGYLNLSFNPKKFLSKGKNKDIELVIQYQTIYEENPSIDIKLDKNNCQLKSGDCCINMAKEVEMEGSGDYTLKTNSYNFDMQLYFVLQPQCIQSHLVDPLNNNLENNGSLMKPKLSYDNQNVKDFCNTQRNNQICNFSYVLQIQDQITVNMQTQSELDNIQEKFSGEGSFKYQLQSQQNSYNKQVKFRVLKSDFEFSKKVEFYDTYLFKYKLDGSPYQQGSNIFAQLQIDSNMLDLGFTLQFYKATLNDKKIAPFDMFQSNEGYINLSFNPKGYIQKGTFLNKQQKLIIEFLLSYPGDDQAQSLHSVQDNLQRETYQLNL